MVFNEHVKIRKEKFGTVVFETLTEKIFVTNEIGGEILALIEQGKDLPAILAHFAAQYDADNNSAMEKDVNGFIAELRTNKFIKDEAIK